MASYNPNAQAPGKTQTQPQSAADVHQAAIDKHGKEAVTQYYNALAGQKAAGANQQQAQAPQVETAGAPAQAPQGNNAVAPGAAGLIDWLGQQQGAGGGQFATALEGLIGAGMGGGFGNQFGGGFPGMGGGNPNFNMGGSFGNQFGGPPSPGGAPHGSGMERMFANLTPADFMPTMQHQGGGFGNQFGGGFPGMGQANPWLGQGQRAQPASQEAFLQMGGGRPWGF